MVIRQRPRSARLLVVSLVAASLTIITVDYRAGDEGPLESVGRATSSALSPLQRAVSNVVQPVSSFFGSLGDLPSLASENRRLEAELEDIRAAQQQNAELLEEIEMLRGFLDLKEFIRRPIAARVIARSGVSNFEWTITIDKGSDDRIAVDMPVVAGDAEGPRLVGKVIRVTPTASIVQLLIDRDFAVAAKLSTSDEAGLVTGRGEDDLRMDLLAPETDISETEPESVFTLGYEIEGQASLFPADVLIGTVSRAISEPGSVETYVTVRPAVDFSTLQYVVVIGGRRPGRDPAS